MAVANHRQTNHFLNGWLLLITTVYAPHSKLRTKRNCASSQRSAYPLLRVQAHRPSSAPAINWTSRAPSSSASSSPQRQGRTRLLQRDLFPVCSHTLGQSGAGEDELNSAQRAQGELWALPRVSPQPVGHQPTQAAR